MKCDLCQKKINPKTHSTVTVIRNAVGKHEHHSICFEKRWMYGTQWQQQALKTDGSNVNTDSERC